MFAQCPHFILLRFSAQVNNLVCRVKNVGAEDLVRVAEAYLVDPAVSGRTLIGPPQTGLENLGWGVQNQ